MRTLILLALFGLLTPVALVRDGLVPDSEPNAALVPSMPTTDDAMTLQTATWLASPCWDVNKVNVRVDHDKRRVRVDLRYAKVHDICTSQIVCHEQDVTIPKP